MLQTFCPSLLWFERPQIEDSQTEGHSALIAGLREDIDSGTFLASAMQHSFGSPGPLLPYEGVTRDTLRQRWLEERSRRERTFGKCEVLPFHKELEKHGHFSNWFLHDPIQFEVPCWCSLEGLPAVVPVTFFEKAIMLCKAGFFRDRETYAYVLKARFPKEAKDLGQGVQGFDEELWGEVICSVAFEVVLQKYGKSKELCKLLMATGSKLLAEAAPNDAKWGIGLKSIDPSIQIPEEWPGSNVLGWALMEARDCLASGPWLADGTLDMAVCREYARRTAHGYAEGDPVFTVGLAAAADVADPSGVSLLQKVISNLMQVPVDRKFLRLKDEVVRQRCADCYEDVAAVLSCLGFSFDETMWIYSSDLDDDGVRQLLRGTQRHLMQVAWLNHRHVARGAQLPAAKQFAQQIRAEHSSEAQQDISSAASAKQDISVDDAGQQASNIIQDNE